MDLVAVLGGFDVTIALPDVDIARRVADANLSLSHQHTAGDNENQGRHMVVGRNSLPWR